MSSSAEAPALPLACLWRAARGQAFTPPPTRLSRPKLGAVTTPGFSGTSGWAETFTDPKVCTRRLAQQAMLDQWGRLAIQGQRDLLAILGQRDLRGILAL